MGSSTLRYTSSAIFETFPFPQDPSKETESLLEQIGEKYHNHRQQLMLKMQLGLTKTYNQFHNQRLSIIHDPLTETEIEKKHGKETLNLWKHLARTINGPKTVTTSDPFSALSSPRRKPGSSSMSLDSRLRTLAGTSGNDGCICNNDACSFNEAVEGILELRRLHKEMDEAALKAYGWTDINLAHDFYEVDYLPENDRIRYTISPVARREILKRLLELNHEIHAQEMEAEKQTTPAYKPRKGKKQKVNDTQSSMF